MNFNRMGAAKELHRKLKPVRTEKSGLATRDLDLSDSHITIYTIYVFRQCIVTSCYLPDISLFCDFIHYSMDRILTSVAS